LTPRQNGVLGLLLEGFSNKEIARQLICLPTRSRFTVSALLRCFACTRVQPRVAAAALRAEAIGHCGPLAAAPMLQSGAEPRRCGGAASLMED